MKAGKIFYHEEAVLENVEAYRSLFDLVIKITRQKDNKHKAGEGIYPDHCSGTLYTSNIQQGQLTPPRYKSLYGQGLNVAVMYRLLPGYFSET